MTLTNSDSAALDLLQRVHRGGGPLEPEYPLAFRSDWGGGLVALEDPGEAGRIVSACTTSVRRMRSGEHSLTVGMIGAVSTEEGVRGKGFGSRLLRRAEERLEESGCTLALLWAEEADFYVGRGYCEVGAERDLLVARDDVWRMPRDQGVRPFRPEDAPSLHELYSRHEVRAERDVEQSAALFMAPGVRTFVLESRGAVRAYACMGRGNDLEGVVHEWGGAEVGVAALVRALAEDYLEGASRDWIAVMAPMRDRGLALVLRSHGAQETIGFAGMARLLSPQRAAHALATYLPGIAFECDGASSGLIASGPAGRMELGSTQVLQLLWPAYGDSATLVALEQAVGVRADSPPPPWYVWGLDSI